jgi:hypothetical protein
MIGRVLKFPVVLYAFSAACSFGHMGGWWWFAAVACAVAAGWLHSEWFVLDTPGDPELAARIVRLLTEDAEREALALPKAA